MSLVSAYSPVEEHLAQELRQRLLVLRERAGLTQEQVAERAHLSRNHYQLLEAGLSDRAKRTPANPRLTTLADLAAALECSLADLVDGLNYGR